MGKSLAESSEVSRLSLGFHHVFRGRLADRSLLSNATPFRRGCEGQIVFFGEGAAQDINHCGFLKVL
jgi:hypothetical protein